MIYASVGRYEESADLLDAEAAYSVLPEENRLERQRAAEILRVIGKRSGAPTLVSDFVPKSMISRTSHLDFVYLYAGAAERALQTYEDTLHTGQVGGQGGTIAYLWHPSYAAARKTTRFKAFARAAGMVEYWRMKGWPDLCRSSGTDDFVCN
jgi:hypothetical protein